MSKKLDNDEDFGSSDCYRDVSIGGVPHRMSIIDGEVMFSDKSGFWGVSGRFVFEYVGMLWYLVDAQSTWNKVPACHLAKMHKLLGEYIGPDHTEADGSSFELSFKRD